MRFSRRGLGDIEREVLNVMVDWLFPRDIAKLAGLEREQVTGALSRLATRGLVASAYPEHGKWALTHAGRRVVR